MMGWHALARLLTALSALTALLYDQVIAMTFTHGYTQYKCMEHSQTFFCERVIPTLMQQNMYLVCASVSQNYCFLRYGKEVYKLY